MGAYIVRRVLATIPVMFVVALIVFSLLYLAPGDPAELIAGDDATPAQVQQIRNNLGLDEHFLVRFGTWLLGILQGDLGISVFTNIAVWTLIADRLEPTLSLMGITIVLAVLIAVPLGVVAAALRGTLVDRLVMGFSVLGFSVPVFVTCYLFAYVFAVELRWLPVQGYQPISQGLGDWLRHILLPGMATATVFVALIARITRASMLEALQQDYIRTAHAKGLLRGQILFIHALKNAAVPIVTIIGIGTALLIGGIVVTETVFGIPGVGRLTVEAILRRDYPVIQGVVLFFSFVCVLVNLVTDLIYTVFDPRIRY